MSERTLSAVEVSDAIRKPSFELQQAAIVAGYASVRDFVLAEAVEEIRRLKGRVESLEAFALNRALTEIADTDA